MARTLALTTLILCWCTISASAGPNGDEADSLREWIKYRGEQIDGDLKMLQKKSMLVNKHQEASEGEQWLAMGEIHEHMTESELGVLRTKLNAGLVAKGQCAMDLAGAGGNASICEQGYLQVASLCCNFQMELFIVRVITSMGYKVCHEGGVMGMIPWFTCGNFQSLRDLKKAVNAGTNAETPCPIVGRIGQDCPEWSAKCWDETGPSQNEGAHRRRFCESGKDKGAGPDWTHESQSPGSGGTITGPTTTIIGGGGGSGTQVVNIYNIAPSPPPVPYPTPAPEPCNCGCLSTFQHMGGTAIMQATITGDTEELLDYKCCQECVRHDDCTFWVRQFNQDGRYLNKPTICWLRKEATGESYNLGYRGGWRTPGLCFKADAKQCLSSFQMWSGSNIKGGKIPICGKDDRALDAACQKACVDHRDCTHWYRDADEGGLTACQLMYNPGSEYKNRPYARGGWKQGCSPYKKCDATFQDRGGPQVRRMGVYGTNHAELDAACCQLCSQEKDCEHWVREWGNYGNRVCYLRKAGGGPSWSWTKRGGWNKICGERNPPKAVATFQEMAGILVATERVCGLDNKAIDAQCALKCLANSLCDYWVREKKPEGFTICWLRKFNTKPVKSANANRRGGYRDPRPCGKAYTRNGCQATYQHLSGTQVALEFVCGNTDEELDAHCCELCRNTTDCQFWVRETRKTTDTDERPKLCYLRKNFGGASKHATFRGGFRQGCGSKVAKCESTFQERSGPQVEIVGVCGPTQQYLDAACCQKCAENPDCEFWVRDTNYPLEVHGATNTSRCYLRKIGALNPSVNVNKRGGWNRICGTPGLAKCKSQFQDQPGLQIAQLRICGRDDQDLDNQCCAKCKDNDFCEYWIREKSSKGFMYCWLRRRDSPNRVPTANVNRRGGYRENAKCGYHYLKNGCRSTFFEMSGSQVGLEYVCGKTDDELDAHCCAKCRNNTACEFWVREVRPATETDITRPKICWLRKNAGSGSRNVLRAGGWRQGCDTNPTACAATFQERSGAQVTKVGVCGADPYSRNKTAKEYLDSVCCDLCAKHPDCEFWVREVDLPTKAQGGENTSFCYLRKTGAVTSAASTTKRGGWNRICGNPSAPKRKSSWQDLAGNLVDTTRVCGKNDTALDTQCAFKCTQHDFCDHWVRETNKGSSGWVTCWLRSTHPNPNVKPNANVNRRGGYREEPKCGDFYLKNGCKATFWEMSGAQVDLQYVCGNNDAELDAHCCALCRNHTDCEFWVRERRLAWEEDASRPKICWLRKNAGGASNNYYRRGGWKSPCSPNVEKCWATFQDRSGPQVQKLGACDASADRKKLDSICCDLCAKNEDCEFWVRETDIPFKNNTFCYLRKLGAANPTSRTNKRGGWNKICGNPKLPPRRASFQNMGGGLVETTRVCSNSSYGLDTECAAKCKENEFCEFWLRETHPTYSDTGFKYCWLYRKATSRSASTVRRGGWRDQKPCGKAYMNNKCTNSSFWELSGSQAALTFVCGDTDAQLDAMCCSECKNNTMCEFWVRESGDSGVKQCWLRYNPGGFSKNLARRGGWKNGCAKDNEYPAAKATFQDWSGPEVNKLGVCGDTSEQLDKACAYLCEQNKDCEFWVREHGVSGQTNQKNSKFCWLRKIAAASQSANSNRRGSRKKCNSGELPQRDHTFENLGGSHIETNRTCGDNDKQLDAGCAAKCEANPSCEFWLRESMAVGSSMGYKYCWLYRNPAAYPSKHAHRRGGFRKQEMPQCGAAFKDMHGRQVGHLKVYGETDEIIDSACCFACTKMKECEFWVREYHNPTLEQGGKNCWLRATVPGGARQNANSRRGGMKMGLMLPQVALVELTEEEKKTEQEEHRRVEKETAEAAAEALALEDYISVHDKIEAETEHLHVLGAAQMTEATRSVHNSTMDLDQAAVKMIQERQAVEMKLEADALKTYYQHKLNTAGETASLDEEGYKSIASLRSHEQMKAFIRRTIDWMSMEVVNEGGLSGLTPFYSGEQDSQNFETLQVELEKAAHGRLANRWVVVKQAP